MVDSQREKLKPYPHKYLSISITADGAARTSVPADTFNIL